MSDPAVDPGASAAARPRSLKRSLASIVLGFELVVVFLGALVLFGLGSLPPTVALGGGAALCLVMVATIALLRFPFAYLVGWAVQAVIILSGIFNPALFVVGLIFAALWTYCMISGTRIDRQKEIA
ncbi:DUF4233 domain-containing protein [Glaciibacter sp. 2TAF33]|uniref:DUF4233 domain-containing protein n=1 Tax=Glaciibacter sp. 2TAF33 TaxID=3233015 RepID=UPI003F91C66E